VLAGALCLLVGGVFLAQVAHAHSSGMKRLVRSTDMDDFEGRKKR
jgi:asparagine synthetase A